MDYDTTNKPPPAPTEEATHSLEDMIKKRIADARYVEFYKFDVW
jgi:U3 small nucleolar ribonucleoprotein component